MNRGIRIPRSKWFVTSRSAIVKKLDSLGTNLQNSLPKILLSYGLNFRLHTRIGFMKTVATVITSTTGFWMPLVEIERVFSALPMQRLWLRLTRVHSTTPCHTYTINLLGTIATRTSMGILQGLSRRRRRESMKNNVQFLVRVVTAKVENHNKFLVTVFEILYTV